MNTKMVLAILGVAVVAAALVGVSAAQFAGVQHQTIAYQSNPNCVNTATGQQVCANNGPCTNAYYNSTCTGDNCTETCTNQNCNQTNAGNCNNTSAFQNQNQYCNQNNNCYTEQNQNQIVAGMMERNSNGRGCHR
jgi:hypothetical protein